MWFYIAGFVLFFIPNSIADNMRGLFQGCEAIPHLQPVKAKENSIWISYLSNRSQLQVFFWFTELCQNNMAGQSIRNKQSSTS